MTTSIAPPDRVSVWPAVLTVVAMACLPYVALLASNVGEVLDGGRVLTWWLLTLAAGLVPVGLAALHSRRAARWVGAVAGVALYLFFHYRVVTDLREPFGVTMSAPAWWAVASLVVLAVAVPLARLRSPQVFLAILAPALLVLPAVQLVTALPAAAEPPDRTTTDAAELVHTPDVWWFVLDGQAGPPFLRGLGMDPDPFIGHLETRGFDVLEHARSNYPFTHLAVASAMDMEYLYEGTAEPGAGPYFERLQGDNRTVDTFLANGYGYVHAYPGLWTGSRCSGREDVCFGDNGPLGDTEWALRSMTPLLDLTDQTDTNVGVARAQDPLHVTEQVLAARPAGPTFSLIHVINPHPPYLRDADCRLRDVPLSFAAWGEGPEYADAVRCLFDRLEASVGRILEVDEDPVIIIQGDHGPRLGLSAETTGEVLLDGDMFFSALSAIRLPEPCADLDVPEDLTLVNTFRVVFACLEDRRPELLEDRTYPILRDYGD